MRKIKRLQAENERLKTNWEQLREFVKKGRKRDERIYGYGCMPYYEIMRDVQDKMNEIEKQIPEQAKKKTLKEFFRRSKTKGEKDV